MRKSTQRIGPSSRGCLQHTEHEHGESGRRQHDTDDIELGLRNNRRCIRQHPRRQQDDQDDDGLGGEGDPPGQRGREPPADQRAKGRTCGSDAEQHAVGRRSLVPLVVRPDKGVDGWHDQRRTESLENRPTEDDEPDGRGQGGDRRSDAVDDQSDAERSLGTPDVAQLAAREHEGGHRERVQRDGGLDLTDRGVEVLDERRDRDVHDRRVDHIDEHRRREDGEDDTSSRGGLARRLEVVGHETNLALDRTVRPSSTITDSWTHRR